VAKKRSNADGDATVTFTVPEAAAGGQLQVVEFEILDRRGHVSYAHEGGPAQPLPDGEAVLRLENQNRPVTV
jgi:hypothetical protein